MIVLWSPYTAGSAASVVDYLLAPTIEKSVAGRREKVVRDPAPEVLYGDPDLVHSCIEALSTRHRYCCATLSFARKDVDIAEWKTGDHELRRRVDGAIALWCEIAFCGVAQEARPPVLTGTHLHTGRLEVNILAPRFVMAKRGARYLPRALNPHPPTGGSRAIWQAYQHTLNGTFGWADPGDLSRRAAVRGPGWIEKKAAELDRWIGLRVGSPVPISEEDAARVASADPPLQILLAAKSLGRQGARDRNALLAGLTPILEELHWRADATRGDALVLWPDVSDPRDRLILRGPLCEIAPEAPSSTELRDHTRWIKTAPARLTSSLARLAEERRRTLPFGVTSGPTVMDPMALLAAPDPMSMPVPLLIGAQLRRHIATLTQRIALAIQRMRVMNALTVWAARATDGLALTRKLLADLADRPPIQVAKPRSKTTADPALITNHTTRTATEDPSP